jgi:hypothetical protein
MWLQRIMAEEALEPLSLLFDSIEAVFEENHQLTTISRIARRAHKEIQILNKSGGNPLFIDGG